MAKSFPALLFGCLAILILAILTPRVWLLRKLYLDSDLRSTVRVELNGINAQEGILLSDMLVQEVTDNTMRFRLQFHRRGADNSGCLIDYFSTGQVHFCAKSGPPPGPAPATP
ncbi:MAG: hypothetical protein Greene041619_286 [Candidatus Peregrinibacteria bacterium Greene0416_19]|nr:MAG: hypothetical protein Greene041619_286 [Candidatus Peregrinibacteria bacterium Greene0416_19]